jgi:hypothetical protein
MKKVLVILLSIVALITDFTNCEIYSSTDELVKLVDSQRILIEAVEKFVEEIDNEILTLKRFEKLHKNI